MTTPEQSLTWCCAAWSGCPSPALDVRPCIAPIDATTCSPARLLARRPRLRPPLSSSRTRSGRCHCPASPQHLSSKWEYPTNTQSLKRASCTLSFSLFRTKPHLYLLANIFGLCYKAEAVAFGFSRQKGHMVLTGGLHHTPLVVLLHTQQHCNVIIYL